MPRPRTKAQRQAVADALGELDAAVNALEYQADGFSGDVIEAVLRDVRSLIHSRRNAVLALEGGAQAIVGRHG
jgi:hypothetical protein